MFCIREADIRRSLERGILKSFCEDGESRVVHELGVMWGNSRVDIGIINGELHAYEIKSQADTLERLPRQAKIYNQIFDKLNIVTHERHEKELGRKYGKLMENWGVLIVSNGKEKHDVKITEKKKPRKNRNTNLFSIAHLLWKEEALVILNGKDPERKGLPGRCRKDLYKMLCALFRDNENELRELIRSKLKFRKSWRLGKAQAQCGA